MKDDCGNKSNRNGWHLGPGTNQKWHYYVNLVTLCEKYKAPVPASAKWFLDNKKVLDLGNCRVCSSRFNRLFRQMSRHTITVWDKTMEDLRNERQ